MRQLILILSFLLFQIYCLPLKAQNPRLFGEFQTKVPRTLSASEIQLALKKAQVLGSVLYFAAHPDDENTALLASLANGELLRTAYLSLTRGDGGQNLIGPEQRELMGLIRTQELLQARLKDGGEQFFSRANDFGYSKDAQEAFQIWDREKVLADAVWVIRNYRPDVIITRFPPTRDAGHGHHEGSAIIAQEAFQAAGDPKRFPEQLKYVKVWTPKRLVWNAYSRRRGSFTNIPPDSSSSVPVDLHTYNPLLGKSHQVIAAESRSMHKSQGFGAAKRRQERVDHLMHVAGEAAQESILDGIDTSWGRVEGGKKIGKLLQQAYQEFKPENPAEILGLLLEALNLIRKNPSKGYESKVWLQYKEQEILRIIQHCAGLWLDANPKSYRVSAGDSLEIRLEAVNRLAPNIRLQALHLMQGTKSLGNFLDSTQVLLPAKMWTKDFSIQIPQDIPLSQPYWLLEKPSLGVFRVDDQMMIGRPENPAPLSMKFSLRIGSMDIEILRPLMYKWVKADEGELYRNLEISPSIMISPSEKIVLFTNQEKKKINVSVRAGKDNLKGLIKPILPPGWKSEPAQVNFNLSKKEEEINLEFSIIPAPDSKGGTLAFQYKIEGQNAFQVARGLKSIEYPHIPIQTLFPLSEVKLVNIQLQKAGKNIGYIQGAGDDIPSNLRQVGYEVSILEEKDLASDLSAYDAIVIGVRAYNTQNWLKYRHGQLMEYVEAGGTLISQYHTPFRMVVENLGPYPFKITRDRVTVEEAPIRFEKADHPLLNIPNKITSEDFEGWVQERGLYFAGEWDEHYETVLSSNDPGEKSLSGGLLYTEYGKGQFIYTGYSFFRELPAGVAGAYRLFANLLSGGEIK